MACLLCAVGGDVRAETPVGTGWLSGDVELGYRAVTNNNWQSGVFDEYRDYGPGFFGSGNLLLEDANHLDYLQLGNEQWVGDQDQHYEFGAGRWGSYGLEIDYDAFPHTYSDTARTLYTGKGQNVLFLPDGLQTTLQGLTGAAQSAALGNALNGATQIDLGFMYRMLEVRGFWNLDESWRLTGDYWLQHRTGNKPWGMAFGSPGNNFTSFAAPVDDRTQQANTGITFQQPSWSLSLNYLGSFYNNDVHSIVVDNFLRATDSATAGSSRGRESVTPSNSANGLSLAGGWTLPVAFPTRITGAFAWQYRRQNDPFLPYTINSALTAGAGSLPQSRLDGVVNTYLGNFVLTTRPIRDLNLKFRYRNYQYSNDTGTIPFPAEVINDRTLSVGPPGEELLETEPLSYHTQNASFDGAYYIARPLTLSFGYAWERWDRSLQREVLHTDEHTARLSFDYRPTGWALLRAGYKYSGRDGSDYRVGDTGNLPGLRKFDQANRIRHGFNLMGQVSPLENLDFSVDATFNNDRYDQSSYGLQRAQDWTVGGDVAYRPLEWLAFRLGYQYEENYEKQRNRFRQPAPPPPDDPTADWISPWHARMHNITAGLQMNLIQDLLDLDVDYAFQRSKDQSRAHGSTGSGIGSVTGATDWPADVNTLQELTTALAYHATKSITFKAYWRWERYDITDFRTDSLLPFMPASNINGRTGAISPSTDVFLGNRWGDYNAHIFGLSAVYKF
jgi:MtrB/PioB family decaheme-associated outer membrane protein